ncbi:MAG: YARHG domain-containing protein [Polyangiaceae bacterium]|nr:YARHG domain-containing protein [Polyangiaceae bacterium]
MPISRRAPLLLIALSVASCGDDPAAQSPASASASQAKTSAAAASASQVTASARPTASATPTASQQPAPAAARQLYYEAPIQKADLEGRTLRELALMRNWIYARAGNPFRKPWLDEFFRSHAWYAPKDKLDESKISKLDKDNARAIAELDAAITREDLEKRRDAVLARKAAGPLSKEDAIELSLLSQRLGAWLGGEGEGPSATPLDDQKKLDKLLTVEELSTLSRRDLRILRNTIYARRGRPFESAVVKSYFQTASWYKPSADYHDGMLTEIDRKNIAIVRSVEDSLGGPAHENPEYGKEGWFVQA